MEKYPDWYYQKSYHKNRIFKNIDVIKQLHIYPPENGKCNVIVVYEIEDVEVQKDNKHYLSIDLGLHNLMTCYDSKGTSFILGRQYLSICRKYDKEIARIQSQVKAANQMFGNSIADVVHGI